MTRLQLVILYFTIGKDLGKRGQTQGQWIKRAQRAHRTIPLRAFFPGRFVFRGQMRPRRLRNRVTCKPVNQTTGTVIVKDFTK